MNSYLKLTIAALLPVLLSFGLFLLEKTSYVKKANKTVKQVIYGVAFGLLAIIGTHWGIPVGEAVANCRDASVLSAGLFFGWQSGLIAGVIGGVERWIAAEWGVGTFTKVACSVSTVLAGVLAAILSKVMFEEKKPGVFLSFGIGIVTEVFHLTMVFITNISNAEKAMLVVRDCAIPMIIANGFSVLFVSLGLSILNKEFFQKLKGKTHISQTIQRWLLLTVAIAFALTTFFVYRMQDELAIAQRDGLLHLAVDEVKADISDAKQTGGQVAGLTKNRNVGKTGYILIFDDNNNVVSCPLQFNTENTEDFKKAIEGKEIPAENEVFSLTVGEENVFCLYARSEGYYILSVYPEQEAMQMRNIALYVNTFMEILVFGLLFFLIYMLIKKVIVDQMKIINVSLGKIANGNLNEVVDVKTSEEFASLSKDINSTVDTLKRYIAEASARIDKELEFARNIQSSALPNVFPAFPQHKEFDIYAMMDTAKEVGGDFYDFYMTHKTVLNFLIADVSGKGIPAAMFMMRAKTELKSLTENDLSIDEVFTKGNEALCEGNDAGMFVTAWQGRLNTEKGIIRFVNAGHNPPLVKRANGKFEYLKTRAGFVLAGMENLKYKMQEFEFNKGDILFLYTDGVTEATNSDNELFGEDRLLDTLNSKEFADMKELCEYVKTEVDKFVGEAVQFDDITMLALKLNGEGENNKVEKEFNADINELQNVIGFFENELSDFGCPLKTQMQIDVAVEEIFVNIANYAYKDSGIKDGKAKITLKIKDGVAEFSFYDNGTPFNPLERVSPDVTLSAEEREIGGLGIFMVKKTMDDVSYKYENGYNVLTVKKKM